MPNEEMTRYWNDAAGPVWVAQQERLDEQIGALGALARERAAIRAGERVLDVGCGCGGTSIELAEQVGTGGRVLAVDLSRPMLERGKQRARAAGLDARIDWRLDDAQTAALGDDAFDLVYSRFGVMFFADPVAAFANLQRSLRRGGRVAFVCWQGPDKNPWMIAPAMAAAKHVAFPPPPAPNAPGPMAFADPVRVRGILESAGFADVAHEPVNGPMRLAGSTLDEVLDLAMQIGPVGAALREAKPTEDQRARAVAAVREMLASFQTPRGIEAEAGAWIVTARKE